MDAQVKLGHSTHSKAVPKTCACGADFLARKNVSYCDTCRKLPKDKRPKFQSARYLFPHPYWWGINNDLDDVRTDVDIQHRVTLF